MAWDYKLVSTEWFVSCKHVVRLVVPELPPHCDAGLCNACAVRVVLLQVDGGMTSRVLVQLLCIIWYFVRCVVQLLLWHHSSSGGMMWRCG